ncbi:hypothetical protein [Flavobacterium flavipallidum]|uniref:Uncharacterized protein n=1 Tax=Flavobacterium flavipallidum TaxID=3139140 RepID=A0ABU9HIP4_9FLAO
MKKKENDHSLTVALLFFLIYRILVVIISDGSTFFNISFYLILFLIIGVLFIKYSSIYNNTSLFFLLCTFLFIIFPLSHEILFKYTSNNYTFSEDYLKHRKREITLQLDDYKDVNKLIKISKELPTKIQNLSIVDSLIGKKYHYKSGFFIIDPESIGMRPQDRERDYQFYDVIFYDKNSKKTASVRTTDESIIKAIHLKYNKSIELKKNLKNPTLNTHYADIWLDSVTIFLFSNIKPIGRATQIIQLFQVITSFFFAYMLTTLLDNFKNLKILKKE